MLLRNGLLPIGFLRDWDRTTSEHGQLLQMSAGRENWVRRTPVKPNESWSSSNDRNTSTGEYLGTGPDRTVTYRGRRALGHQHRDLIDPRVLHRGARMGNLRRDLLRCG